MAHQIHEHESQISGQISRWVPPDLELSRLKRFPASLVLYYRASSKFQIVFPALDVVLTLLWEDLMVDHTYIDYSDREYFANAVLVGHLHQ